MRYTNLSIPKLVSFKKNEFILFLAGVNLMLLNFILVQHMTVAIRQAEIAVLIFSLAYFSGISIGVFVSDRISISTVKKFIPLFLLVQMALLILSQDLVYVLGEHTTETGTCLIMFLILTFFSTSLYSVFLPLAVDHEGQSMTRSYSLEISGSIVGLILIPILASISHKSLLGGYFLSFLGVCWLLKLHRFMLVTMAVAISIFLIHFNDWDKVCATWFYQHWYSTHKVEKVVHTLFTPYHKIEVAKLEGDEYMLLLNGKRQFAAGSHTTYSYFVADHPSLYFENPKVGILGCGSMSTVGTIGTRAQSFTIVDLDENVFKTSKKYFQKYNHLDELKNWTFTADDAKHYLGNSSVNFDLILHDIPPARSRQTALTYTAEFFELVKNHLTPNGIFSISALSASESTYGRKMMATLAHTFDAYYALEYDGSIYFYGGRAEMEIPSREAIFKRINYTDKANVKILLKEDIDAEVKGEDIITINNVGDLIFG